MPRGFTSHTPVNNRCNVPSFTIVVDFLGNCLLCDCDGWLPIPVGKVGDFNTIEEVFASPQAQMIQQDVANGNFSWCAVDHCGIRNNSKIRSEVTLLINIDESCNLHCPSCRREPIMISQGNEYEKKIDYVNRVTTWLESYDKKIHIVMSGNGDPLASHIMRPLIKNFIPKENQKFTIFTNGLLIKKQLDKLPILDHVRQFKISVDAGSEEVYQDVRPPGVWKILLENFDYIKSIDKNPITVLNFAFQNKNYQDLPNFVDLCNRYGFTGNVHQLEDWGTWSQISPESKDAWTIKNGTFDNHDVLKESHVNYSSAKSIVKDLLDSPRINFSPYLLSRLGLKDQRA